jgi:hypothetical protein
VRPLVVIEGSPTAVSGPLEARLDRARLAGWRVIRGWAAPLTLERIVCTAAIASPDDARRALLAALSGAGLIVGSIAGRETTDRLLDELRALGEVEHVLVESAPPGTMLAGPRESVSHARGPGGGHVRVRRSGRS